MRTRALAKNRQKRPETSTGRGGRLLQRAPLGVRARTGGACLPRSCAGIACKPIGATSKAGSATKPTVRTSLASTRRSSALIRAGLASSACRARRGLRYGDAAGDAAARTVRNNRAIIACRSVGRTSTSGSETGVAVRNHAATKREPGALIRVGIIQRRFSERGRHLDDAALDIERNDGNRRMPCDLPEAASVGGHIGQAAPRPYPGLTRLGSSRD